ncbi:MAG TPA: sigma-70 family RNA polymerase sigma factor [Planctomycetota bacterium]|nr:sigma-70 family RNA polymerase sigma factor [Planctomycetota bacterium]
MSGPSADDDWRLVRRVVDDGDRSAFDLLVAKHSDRLYGTLHRVVGDPEQAMNLAQETFFKAWRGLRGFSGEASFFTWLYRIARNAVTSAARYDGARPKISASLDAPSKDDARPRIEPAAEGADPAARLLAEERRELVIREVAALPPDFREVVVLRDFEDRPYEEIAELLGVAVGTVKSRLHRGRAALAERLRPAFAGARAAR